MCIRDSPLGMSCSRASMRCIKGKEYCSIVTSMAQNGVETGIKVAGLGEQWFKGPAPRFVGTLFSTQWTLDDAVPYMGDSTATESYGMGAFSAAAAPTVLRLRNGGWREAWAQSEELRTICAGRNNNFPIPLLDFEGPGLGIDIFKVVESGITPLCHGGIVNKTGGQIGAGAARYGTEEVYKRQARGSTRGSSLAGSSSARRWRASSRASRRPCCWTSPSRRWTAT